MDLVANSTPMVDFDSKLNSFLVNRESRFDLPTPESPIRTTVARDIVKKDQTQLIFTFFLASMIIDGLA